MKYHFEEQRKISFSYIQSSRATVVPCFMTEHEEKNEIEGHFSEKYDKKLFRR